MAFSFREAVEYAQRKRVALPSEYYGEMQGKARNQAFSIAGVASRDQLQGVLDSLNAVLRDGKTFKDWKDDPSVQALGLPAHRLDNILRTNMQCAYNAGHWEQQQANKDRRPYLMYDAINDSRTRPSHLALDNIIKPIDDPFWDVYYPPNGFRCRCTTISMTAAQANARGGETEDPDQGWPDPDKGWDYNPGADPEEGIIRAEVPLPRGDSNLQSAMEESLRTEQQVAKDMDDLVNYLCPGQDLDQYIQAMRDSKDEAITGMGTSISRLDGMSILQSASYLSTLVEEEQAYLRLVSDQGKLLQPFISKELAVVGILRDAEIRMTEDILASLRDELVTAPVLYREIPANAGYVEGSTIDSDTFISVYAKEPAAGRPRLIISEGSSQAIPISFITSSVEELEWLIAPGSKLQVTRVSGLDVYAAVVE
jgi:SPP1 gp7 family putative phage head morphogenesis protein